VAVNQNILGSATGLSTATVQKTESRRKTDVTDGELETYLKSGDLQLFDVRDAREIQETGRIATAVNIPLTVLKMSLKMTNEDFEKKYGVPKPKMQDTNIVFYGLCAIKSLAALEIAHKMGYKKARHYPGGWDAWSKLYTTKK